MAVGSGSTLADARSRAMQNLAQIFRSQISGSQDLYSKFEETSRNNEGFTSGETLRLINNIRIGADEELMNTEILQSYVANNGQYYVLAGMDRISSARVYKQEMANNSTKIEHHLANSKNQHSLVLKLGELKQAVLLAQINENLARQLAIIQPGATNSEAVVQKVMETENELKKVQQQALVVLHMDAEHPQIKDAVAKVFQEQGFSITNGNDGILEATIDYKAVEANLERDDADFVQWNLRISITEIANKRTYEIFTLEGREGALNTETAFKRAEFTAVKEIEKKFTRFLNSQLTPNGNSL